ncbi:MAG: hypothetical protein CL943_00030 [Candidatus Diapherotrites archaeon]|uniref:Uncharacterized protein n=1 Tax=Candidatus Iainarchaeum sp. TaxID=3101447 RepID=A0A2D6LZS1_9ARCH|nr:hypothetical protein [Candidatus Diapherotrites archaeon]
MQVKILLLLVFLTLFGNSAFSGTYPDCVGTTDVGGCAAKPETTCENYFATMKDCGYKQCKWSASNCVSATKCKVDLRTTVTNCTPITVGTCTN